MSRRRAVWLLAVGIAVVGGGAVSAQNGVSGEATIGSEKARFAPAVGFWNPATNRVSIAFVAQALSPGALAEARKARRWQLTGRSIVVELDFTPGQTSALAAQMTGCRVTATGFQGKLDLHGGAQACHVLSVGGFLSPPGTVVGILQGQGAGYSLRLPFSLVFDETEAPSAAAAVSGAAPGARTAKTAATSASIPANSVSGSGRYDGQRLDFRQGVAAWNAKGEEVRVALFSQAPPSNAAASLLAGEWNSVAPTMTLYLRLDPGPPSREKVSYCYVELDFPRGGTMGHNTDGKGYGIRSIGGALRAGGNVEVELEGETTGPHDEPYTWKAAFNLPIGS